MQLREVLQKFGLKQTELATYLNLAKSTVNAICNGHYPVGREEEIKESIKAFLVEKGVNEIVELDSDIKSHEEDEEEEDFQIRKNEMLTGAAKKQFSLFRDPFVDDVHEAKDVYLNDNVKYISEYMYQEAKFGGMVAVIGESGSGKSTLRKLLIDKIQASGEKIKIIFPRTLDRTRLTASAICDAIIRDVSDQVPKKTFETKCRQVEQVLTVSSRAGFSHVLMIEEAHDLSIPVLKYLKRFWELEDGFKKLLAVILIAQPEIKSKLDESRNWEAREVIRRIEVVELNPFLDEKELSEYLDLKLKRVGSSAEQVFTADAFGAILSSMTRKTKSGNSIRYCYPLSVNNLVKKAMNTAAEIAEPKVTAEIINAIR